MSRPLRIEYPDAWYHVMNRGRRGEDIFSDEQDYVMFTELLKETSEMWDIRVAAYCLLPNHYHMLVQTPEANISRSMRHLNGVYTQRYNRRHKCDGQLFRGRYKSILTDTDSYLLQAVRYIHRNPLGAGLAAKLDAYKWSSHKGYISIAKKWDWLHKNYILSLLSKNRNAWLRYNKKWVSVEGKDKVSEKISGKKWPVCIGPQSFVDRIKEAYGAEKINKDVPSSRELLPGRNRILEEVCQSYDTTAIDILKMRRGKMNEARNVAIYLTRKLRRDTLKEIGAQFGIDSDSTVSSVMARMKKKLAGDRKFYRRLDKIAESIKTS
jgi:putative transposase